MQLIKNSVGIIRDNQYTNKPPTVASPSNETSDLQNLLAKKINDDSEIQFSKHANQRLNTRAIQLSHEQMTRLEEGINIAKGKGIKDSLVLVDNLALVVNVQKKVVITALSSESKNIFTNIDGAVIV